MKFLFLRFLSIIISLSPYRLKSILSGIGGFFWALRDNKRGVVVAKNLNHIGIKNPTLIDIRRVFKNYLMDFFYLISVRGMTKRRLLSIAIGEHLEYFDDALKENRGVILLSAHLGGAEFAGPYISAMGYPLVTVAEWKGVGERHYAFYNRLRKRFGTEVFPLEDRKTPFLIKESLKKNKILALISDRNLTGKGIPTNFLQGKILFPKGPIHYALKFGSPVIIGLMVRRGYKYIAKLYPPIYPENETEGSLLEKIKIFLEDEIKENPYMWYAFQSIWQEDK